MMRFVAIISILLLAAIIGLGVNYLTPISTVWSIVIGVGVAVTGLRVFKLSDDGWTKRLDGGDGSGPDLFD